MAGSSYGVKRSGSTYGPRRKRMRMSTPRLRMVAQGVSQARFVRATWCTNWTFSTATTSGFYRQIQPTFDMLSNSGEYTSLFDVYRINRCKITVIPRFGDTSLNADSTAAPTAYNNQFYMTVGIDKNFTSVPTGTYGSTSFNNMLALTDNVRTYKLDKPFSWTFKPNIVNAAAAGNTLMSAPWILTSSANIPHLGSQAYIHDVNFTALTNSPISVDLICTFYFECKGNR